MDLDKNIFSNKKIAVVTNRAPISPVTRSDKTIIQRSVGGLVAALEPLIGSFDGVWFCTVPKASKLTKMSLSDLPYKVACLELSESEQNNYYEGYSNKQLWPIFHSFLNMAVFNAKDFEVYKLVNEKMADLILENVDKDHYIWIHDYHFMLLPEILRKRNPKLKIGFFLHTPFPNQELFRALSGRTELIKGLLGADMLGFHTHTYVEHFINCAKLLVPEVDKEPKKNILIYENRKIKVGGFPISIDYDHICEKASTAKIVSRASKLRVAFNTDLIGLSIERLDYTKGILERLFAIERFFEKYPEYIEKITFIQISVPTREKVESYQQLKREVDEAIGRINGRFSKDAWEPIFYVYSTLSFDDLIAYYSMSDISLVVPLRDGMNLVAKEYIASNISGDGVLILSEFTGAAEELTEAISINPFHIEKIADAIKEAIEMPLEEKTERMKALRKKIKKNDVYHWINNYFQSFDEAITNNKKASKVS